MAIQPYSTPDINGNLCPPGYTYDAASNSCIPISAQVQLNFQPTGAGGTVTLPDLNQADVDPVTEGALKALGAIKGGWIERLVAAFIHGVLLVFLPVIHLFVSVADALMASLVDCLTAVQSEKTPGFWLLCASLLGDLFGIDVDGAKMAADFNSKGRLTGVRDLGAQIVNILASEFMDVAQTPGGVGFKVAPGSGIGGLPSSQLSPLQGVKAAQAFLGFATEFAVREGNIEAIASEIPHGLGEAARTMAANFARGVNLGRMSRIALKPIFQDLVATPLSWAINQQYRPKLLSAQEAIAAWINTDIQQPARDQELQYAGFSDAKIAALENIHSKVPSEGELRTLSATGLVDVPTYHIYMRRHGYQDVHSDLIAQAHDYDPARRAALAYVEYIAEQVLKGKIPSALFDGLVQGIPFITPGELAAFDRLMSGTIRAQTTTHIRQLSAGLVQKAFVEGLITLNEMQTHYAALGYLPADVQVLELAALEAEAKAAAAGAKKTKAAKQLSVAIAEKAYTEGIITLPELQTHLIALGYAFADVQTIMAEAVAAQQAKASKTTTTPPATPGP